MVLRNCVDGTFELHFLFSFGLLSKFVNRLNLFVNDGLRAMKMIVSSFSSVSSFTGVLCSDSDVGMLDRKALT